MYETQGTSFGKHLIDLYLLFALDPFPGVLNLYVYLRPKCIRKQKGRDATKVGKYSTSFFRSQSGGDANPSNALNASFSSINNDSETNMSTVSNNAGGHMPADAKDVPTNNYADAEQTSEKIELQPASTVPDPLAEYFSDSSGCGEEGEIPESLDEVEH